MDHLEGIELNMDANDPRWKKTAAIPKDPKGRVDLLKKHYEAMGAPIENDLIALYDAYEKAQPEVAKYLDDAIELLSKARGAISHAKSRIK